MGKIVAIGGVTPPSNLDLIDEKIIRLSNKSNPRVLYIPAAGGDNLEYCSFFKSIYEEKFGCHVDFLFLVKETPLESEIRDKVLSADIIYIEGGEVSRLMALFEKYNVTMVLKKAFEKDIVLAGKSAGAICFGKYWLDGDVSSFGNDEHKSYKKVKCLGLVELLICPHYDLPGYIEKLDDMVEEFNITGIGIDNNCAFEIVDNAYIIITTKQDANAYKVFKEDQRTIRLTLSDGRF